MPKLIRLYIVNVAIGFGIALAFVSALVWLDVANLRHLVMQTESGWLAFALLVMFNGVVFAGVQFGIAVMRLAEPEDPPQGGKRLRVTGALARVPMAASRRR
jgi:TRAP-type C4-dicarboxylate transport system permease small subunit